MEKYIVELKKNETLYKAATRESDGTAYVCSAIGTPYTAPDLEQIRKEAYDNGYETAKHECEDCLKQAYIDAIRKEAYQRGLNDAWDTVRKIRGMTWNEQKEVFGTDYFTDIIALPASECIEKIRQYEQEQKELKVGDEVERIINGEVDSKAVFLEDNEGYYRCLFWTGCCFTTLSYQKEQFRKTGRHFDEFATVLEKMREESNG